jgi:hypothetical protein
LRDHTNLSLLRLCLKLPTTFQHVAVAAKTIVAPDGAYVVVGVEVVKMAANANSQGIAATYSGFGDELPGDSNIRAAYCFTDYLEKPEKIDYRRPFHNNGSGISAQDLEQLLLANDSFFDESAELREWRDKLSTMEERSEERATHMQWLFRLGLSLHEGDSRFYSFCNKQWTSQDTHRHCAACKRCYPVDTSWHCGVCRQCRHEGLDRTCYRCGGRSSTAISRQEKEYEIWRTMELEDDSRVAGAGRESTHGSGHHDFNVLPSIEASHELVVGTNSNLSSHPSPLTAPRLEPSGG